MPLHIALLPVPDKYSVPSAVLPPAQSPWTLHSFLHSLLTLFEASRYPADKSVRSKTPPDSPGYRCTYCSYLQFLPVHFSESQEEWINLPLARKNHHRLLHNNPSHSSCERSSSHSGTLTEGFQEALPLSVSPRSKRTGSCSRSFFLFCWRKTASLFSDIPSFFLLF